MKIYLEQIWKAATDKDYDKVRQILNMRLFTYRDARLFCELFKEDYEASEYILKQATCKCGAIVTEWKFNTTPICSECSFKY